MRTVVLLVMESFGLLLDVYGATSQVPQQSEADAMHESWQQAGDDLRMAMQTEAEKLPSDPRAGRHDALVATPSRPPRFPQQQQRRQQTGQVVLRREEHQLRVAPLPSPDELAAFDHVLPGLVAASVEW